VTSASDTLPEPSAEEQERSRQLCAAIEQVCEQNDGAISFAHYMQMALYQPGMGYYSHGSRKFGAQGDFITAPEVSPLFAQCLARQIVEISQSLSDFSILEFGAGSGVMAADILLELERQNTLPGQYQILELSAELRQRQRDTIADKAPELLACVVWLDTLPEHFTGIVLANEVLDAMPVECFRRHGDAIEQMWVKFEAGHLVSDYRPANKAVADAVAEIEQRREARLPDNYCSELNLMHRPWIEALFNSMDRGVVLLIDYGYGVSEYYHAERSQGTLMCHYQHRTHPDPFWCPGVQDITSYVDFSEVAHAAVDAGFEMLGYTSQATFLMGAGLAELHEQQVSDDVLVQVRLSQQIKTLTLPSEMGERFKVMGLMKNMDLSLSGFGFQDLRNRL
jgi:SAM-dependent MidA family methyltransferase